MSARPVWTGALAVAVIAIALTRLDWLPATPRPVATTPAAAVELPIDHFGVPDDASLSLVADLAADLDWDGASEAGLTTHVGADNDVVIQLTDAERRELRELLTGETKRPGA